MRRPLARAIVLLVPMAIATGAAKAAPPFIEIRIPDEPCPASKLCAEIDAAYSSGPDRLLAERFERSLGKYDCKRREDREPVPAWWLCPSATPEKWPEKLSRSSDPYARRLFASARLRATLDGHLAEAFLPRARKPWKKP